ncbi:MAG: hypothetical protein ACE5GW_10815 [Planctomycetota bacterium]
MFRGLLLLLTLGLVVAMAGWIVAQDGRPGGPGRPLDLPSGGIGDDEDEEDAPEVITFYSQEYEGDAFFWCLDKSCSMGWSGGAPIATLKQEMTSAINSLSSRAEFSMVAFNTSYQVWSPYPRRADPGAKASAVGWVQQMTAAGTTCLAAAGVKTVQISNLSGKRHKTIIIVGDGVPECPPPNSQQQNQDTLSQITGSNWQMTPINTIFISASSQGVQFMQTLAAMNGGTFLHVQ